MYQKLLKPEIITVLYLLSVLLFLAVITCFGLRRIPDSAQHRGDTITSLHRGQDIIQEVVPRNNGLNTVLIFFKNPNLGNTDRLIFSLSLPGGAELRHIEISGRNIGDGETVRFQFPPVPDSAGITYLLTISTPDTSPGTPYPLSVAFSSVDAYLPGRVISPAGMTGDLSFQLFYAPVSRGELVADLWHLFLPRVLSLHLFLTTAFVLIFGFRFLRFCISRIPEDR